ncbi:MAG: undecaprenyl-diphosphate phosphatase [Rhodopirellula sp.]|nr:undecaprenyl-diphosphate phosphatase [Rhodopirellula sp.]
MEILHAIILGIVQGIGEFLPISSSGHLVIADALLDQSAGAGGNENASKLLMNVVLHVGTLFSILIVYRKELWKLRLQPKVCLLIILASVPAGLLGVLAKTQLEKVFETPLVVGVALFATAAFLVGGQKLERNELDYDQLSFSKALVIGLFQAIALIPGISRSGSTISGGLLLGLKRDAAAAFSFLMAVPVIGGAALLEAKDVFTGDLVVGAPLPLIVGGLTAFLVGLFTLRWLVSLIAKGRLYWFAYYCVGVGTATICWQLIESVTSIPQ